MELAAAAARIADNQAKHDAAVTRAARILRTLELNLLGLEARLEQAEERRLSEAAAAAATLAEREAEFASSLAHVTHSRELLALQLTVSTAALEDSRQDRAAEAATAAERYRDLEGRLAQEVTAREATGGAAERVGSGARRVPADSRDRDDGRGRSTCRA